MQAWTHRRHPARKEIERGRTRGGKITNGNRHLTSVRSMHCAFCAWNPARLCGSSHLPSCVESMATGPPVNAGMNQSDSGRFPPREVVGQSCPFFFAFLSDDILRDAQSQVGSYGRERGGQTPAFNQVKHLHKVLNRLLHKARVHSWRRAPLQDCAQYT